MFIVACATLQSALHSNHVHHAAADNTTCRSRVKTLAISAFVLCVIWALNAALNLMYTTEEAEHTCPLLLSPPLSDSGVVTSCTTPDLDVNIKVSHNLMVYLLQINQTSCKDESSSQFIFIVSKWLYLFLFTASCKITVITVFCLDAKANHSLLYRIIDSTKR